MKAFVSWSGGKDCMWALHLFLKGGGHEVVCLVNMCEGDRLRSRSHGQNGDLIAAQAVAMNIPLVQQPVEDDNYEKSFRKVIASLKERGVDCGVFGDIRLGEHRDWIERVCDEMGVKAVFPLWGESSEELLRSFIGAGFETIAVAVRKGQLPKSFLGKVLDDAFLDGISAIRGIDPCGENGEFHTFVYDGPLFSRRVGFSRSREFENDKYWFLELKIK